MNDSCIFQDKIPYQKITFLVQTFLWICCYVPTNTFTPPLVYISCKIPYQKITFLVQTFCKILLLSSNQYLHSSTTKPPKTQPLWKFQQNLHTVRNPFRHKHRHELEFESHSHTTRAFVSDCNFDHQHQRHAEAIRSVPAVFRRPSRRYIFTWFY